MSMNPRVMLVPGFALSLACGWAMAQSDTGQRQTTTGNAATTDQGAARSDATRADSMQSDSNDWQQAGQVGDSTAHKQHAGAATAADEFARLDSDRDGRISGAEAAVDNGLSARFKTLDTNSDGYVSSAEFRAGMRADTPPTP